MLPRAAVDVLVFQLDHNRHGVRTDDLLEIVRAVALAPLPGAPGVIDGVFNLRGRMVPVVDARRALHLPLAPLDPGQHFLIVRAGPRTVALRVDHAETLAQVPDESVEDPGAQLPMSRRVTGVAKMPDGLILIHDLSAFLSEAEAETLDSAMASLRAAPMSSSSS
ncbi:MAG TPA: chemotaxis protein CheW [Gemmatimonadaceae bacterium]